MRVLIEFGIDSEAFKYNDEFHAVLDQCADKVFHQLGRYVLLADPAEAASDLIRDSAGNVVGRVQVESDEGKSGMELWAEAERRGELE